MTTPSRHLSGAPLLPPVISYAVLTIAGVAIPPAIAGVAAYSSDADAIDFFQHHVGAAHASAFFTLGAAIPLAIATAVATTRMRTLGHDVPGRIIAQLGGMVASAMLALAGITTLALTQDHVADSPAVIRAFVALTFAAGGPGFVVFSGLLVAGLAISGLITRVLPRPVAWAGIAIAVVSEVASLAAAFDSLDPLLPIGRFGALLWLVVLGFVLPADRRELRARAGVVRTADAS